MLSVLVIGILVTSAFGSPAASPLITVGLRATLAAVLCTGILWAMNRRSLEGIKRSGGEIERVICPFDAVMRALILFPTIVGACLLVRMSINGSVTDWEPLVLFSAIFSYFLALTRTAYQKAR